MTRTRDCIFNSRVLLDLYKSTIAKEAARFGGSLDGPIRPLVEERLRKCLGDVSVSAIKRLMILISMLSILIPSQVKATGYPDWVFQDMASAFTLGKGVVELTGCYLVVNDTVDVFNIRDKELGDSRLLSGSIGDYSGFKGIFNYGLTNRLMLHYSYQYGDLDTSLGTSSTFEGLDSTDTLSTSSHNIGFRLNILSESRKAPALALEAAYLRHDSNDVRIGFTGIRAEEMTIHFADSQNIKMSNLNDDGFELKFLISKTMSRWITSTIWAGYSRYSADTKLSTSISFIKDNFDRKFDMDEQVFSLGISLGIQFFKRMPIFLSYRYLTLDRDIGTDTPLDTSMLARYTDPENMNKQDSNHIFSAKIVYWITPHINLNLDGQLFTNQFLGIVPHYGNPLTNRFFYNTYGYLGMGLGVIF